MSDFKISEDGVCKLSMSDGERQEVRDWLDRHKDNPNVQEFLYLCGEVQRGLWELRNPQKPYPEFR